MTYWLILFPGPIKICVTRRDYEVASVDAAPTVTTKQGKFIIRDKYVFSVEHQDIACVVGRAERVDYSGRDFLKRGT